MKKSKLRKISVIDAMIYGLIKKSQHFKNFILNIYLKTAKNISMNI